MSAMTATTTPINAPDAQGGAQQDIVRSSDAWINYTMTVIGFVSQWAPETFTRREIRIAVHDSHVVESGFRAGEPPHKTAEHVVSGLNALLPTASAVAE